MGGVSALALYSATVRGAGVFVVRARHLNIFAAASAAAGLAAVAGHVAAPSALPAWAGPVLLSSATAAALAAAALTRRAFADLTRLVRDATPGTGRPRQPTVRVADPDLLPLAEAVNQSVGSAHAAAAESALRARELEIRLKLATAERQHAEAIIYSISDAVLVTDPFGELVLANESAARTFEFDLGRAHRSPVEQVLRDPAIVGLIRDMREQSAGGASAGGAGRRVVEHQVRTAAGGSRTYQVTLSSVSAPRAAQDAGAAVGTAATTDQPPPAPGAGGVVVVLHDVTHEKEVAQMKNDFVSNVSHELRTPLASIKAYVELLIDGEADDERTKREFYEVIQNEANRLGRLIDNILNLSRIESGLVKVERQPQSLAVVVKEALEVIAPQAAQKRIELVEQLTPVFYQAMADRDMLYQAVLNLLSNAVKYTPEGGRVTVRTEVDEARRKVVARVTDTGVGIPAKDLPLVFDKFYRSGANSRMAQGTGLGLALVKHVIETVHGGRMIAESQVGKGSCFGFELDLCE